MIGGETLNLEDDSEILKINSPKSSVGGPYSVIYKDVEERWAIVALDFDKFPCLGIRWFKGKGGTPLSNDNPIWLIIPNNLNISILNGLPLETKFRKNIEKFLCHELSGDKLE